MLVLSNQFSNLDFLCHQGTLMKLKGKILVPCFALLLLLYSGLAAGESVDRIVANVNGEIILYSDIRNRIQSIEKIAQDNPKLSIEGVSEREVLQQLIWEKLAAAEIKRLKISVTEGEVDSAIQSIKEENHLTDAQFEQALLRQGQTLKSVRDSIRKQIEQNRLMDRVLKSKIVITDEQVNAYMKTLKAPQASTRQSMRIAVIFLPAGRDGKDIQAAQKQAGEIHSRLKSGADFGRMAREYSKGPGAQDGGDIGFVELEDLAPPIAAAVKGLKKDEISEPVVAPGGVYIAKLLDSRVEKQELGGEDIRERIRRELYQKEVSRQYEQWLKELEARSFIQISL